MSFQSGGKRGGSGGNCRRERTWGGEGRGISLGGGEELEWDSRKISKGFGKRY